MDYHSPYLFGYVIGFIHLLGIGAAIHALLTVRTAQGSIAWAMPLLFIPYFTLIPYLVFGRSSFDAYIKARRQANEEMRSAISDMNWRPWIEEAVAARRSDAYASLRAMPKLGNTPALANNEVKLLINGDDTFAAIFDAIREAKQTVLIQFFIIHDDELGRRLQALLLEKAAQGVDVYVLYDRIGSHALPGSYSEKLRAGGVQIKAFATRSGWLNRFQINFRNHRKIVVVDGTKGFLGGHNVGDEYVGLKPPLAPWRDTHVQVIGPVVACLQESFAEDWFWATRKLPPLSLPDSFPEDGVLCQLLTSGPADKQETCSLFSSKPFMQQRIVSGSPALTSSRMSQFQLRCTWRCCVEWTCACCCHRAPIITWFTRPPACLPSKRSAPVFGYSAMGQASCIRRWFWWMTRSPQLVAPTWITARSA